MSAPVHPSESPATWSDYARPLPPLIGGLLIVAVGTGIEFWFRGLGFRAGFVAIVVASGLVGILIGGFAALGAYVDSRSGLDVVFRLVGAAVGFAALVGILFNLAPTLLTVNAPGFFDP
jgi:hypothetical protein